MVILFLYSVIFIAISGNGDACIVLGSFEDLQKSKLYKDIWPSSFFI